MDIYLCRHFLPLLVPFTIEGAVEEKRAGI